MEHRHRITDELWKRLGPLIAAAKVRSGRKPLQNDRAFLEAVFFVVRTGCPWRDLPPHFGRWLTVYQRFRRWRLNGTWTRLFELVDQAIPLKDIDELFLDSTTVRAHRHAAGAAKKGALETFKRWVAREAA